MIRPTADETLAALIDAFEQDIAPHLRTDDDGYTESLARTFAQLMRSLRVRLNLERDALLAEIRDARQTLEARRDDLERVGIDGWQGVLDAPEPASAPAMPELTETTMALRSVIESLLASDITSAPGLRAELEAHLARSLERESAWTVRAFTGPRR